MASIKRLLRSRRLPSGRRVQETDYGFARICTDENESFINVKLSARFGLQKFIIQHETVGLKWAKCEDCLLVSLTGKHLCVKHGRTSSIECF